MQNPANKKTPIAIPAIALSPNISATMVSRIDSNISNRLGAMSKRPSKYYATAKSETDKI